MPRTKTTSKVASKKSVKYVKQEVELILKHLEEEKEKTIAQLRAEANELIKAYDFYSKEQRLPIPEEILNKTVHELISGNYKDTASSTASFSSSTATQNRTKTTRSTVKRSGSFDEGYLTSASACSGNSGGRQSRSRAKITKEPPSTTSRSLSRSAMQKNVSSFKTPAHTKKNQSFGFITPKCKPGTPQVILRRPKQGEVAVSYQGSPLMTGSIAVDDTANVNIPLPDGSLLSLMPQRGLRMSQIPQVDPSTHRQLAILRDHLNKFCGFVQP